ncbi:LysR substrate-binding domain-containing protein [Agarivorans sp. TSD2052]|uniref:LysR substrate-binding domain-containing protein n=1 Tax=Agarivorans sp. TSD2052 TaxID=2937286 RepID=UPI00200F5841|nr:LysR substrate-binding domain-containing protein [Agarivorans sp. TSD2052]UPW18529.1 LysR substrate-binding domain-containing protein [Agarivorans sp. TSD2052]
MDIDALRSLVAFVESGSFTRAASQTFRTQSAISAQMKKLQQESDSPLFEKEGRSLVLTPAGQALASYARRIVSLHDQAVTELKHSKAKVELRIGCPDDYSLSILPLFTEILQQQIPNLYLRLRAGPSYQLREQLDLGELDLAILTRPPDSDEGLLLRHDQGIWVSSATKDVCQQRPLPLALYDTDCKFHSSAIDGLDKAEIAYHLMATSANHSGLYGLVAQGLAVAAMARSSKGELQEMCAETMPPLPAIDIVVVSATKPHLACNRPTLKNICEQFRLADQQVQSKLSDVVLS